MKQILTWNQPKMQYEVRFATKEEATDIAKAVKLMEKVRDSYAELIAPIDEDTVNRPAKYWANLLTNMDKNARAANKMAKGLIRFDIKKYLAPWLPTKSC